MTKRINRKYLICVEDDGVIYAHKFSRKYRCGSSFYDYYEDDKGIVITPEDLKSSIIQGFNHAKSAKDRLVRDYKSRLPKGERPKVFIKRVHGDNIAGMLAKLTQSK